jgi:hypothetical protein
VLIDGYAGIYWDTVQQALEKALQQQGIHVTWHTTAGLLKPATAVQQLVAPFVGEEGDVWGKRATLQLTDFFQPGASGRLHFNANSTHSNRYRRRINTFAGAGYLPGYS